MVKYFDGQLGAGSLLAPVKKTAETFPQPQGSNPSTQGEGKGARQKRHIAQEVDEMKARKGTPPFMLDLVMIQPQVHLRLPCYDFYFL